MTGRNILKSNYIYFTGLLLLVASLPVSLFMTSISQFVLAFSFFVEGNVKDKFRRFFSNKAALLFAGIWLLHVIGLMWTSEMGEGLKDVKIKLPLLIFAIVIAGNKPLDAVKFSWVLLAFVASVFVSSMISMAVLTGIIHRNIYDIREIFIFNISHIRFALFTCLSIYILIWLVFLERKMVSRSSKIIAVLLIGWFLMFLLIVESVTGLVIFAVTGLILMLCYAIYTARPKARILLITVTIIFPFAFVLMFKKFVNDFYQNHPYPVDTTEKTKYGNGYEFNMEDPQYENGYPVWVYVCDYELRSEWNKNSIIPYDSMDERKQWLKFTLIRFLASKGFRKDADGVSQLSANEIRSVERGIANVNYQDISSIHARLLQIMWEFDHFLKGGDPNGHSVTQRFEFWRAAWGIASSNLIVGVGTGDMPSAFHQKYTEMKTSLDEKHRLRSHNQFLAIMVAFGIIGLLYFLFALFYPLIIYRKQAGFLFFTFFLIGILSMLTEDTLETQAGATFIAFFFSLFLFGRAANNRLTTN